MPDSNRSLKLFVVGESSGDPDEWDEFPRRCLVLAESAEQAATMHGGFRGPAFEVRASRPCVLYVEDFEPGE